MITIILLKEITSVHNQPLTESTNRLADGWKREEPWRSPILACFIAVHRAGTLALMLSRSSGAMMNYFVIL